MASILPLAFRRCSDSNKLSEEGNSSILKGKHLHPNSRTRPYYARRCKKATPANIESSPEELLFQILLHLPADFLYGRARVVCRKWSHIIFSEAFVSTQIRYSTCGLLLSSLPYWRSHPIYVTATQGGRVETCELSYRCRTRIMASCNGLALELLHSLHGKESFSLHVINPATKRANLGVDKSWRSVQIHHLPPHVMSLFFQSPLSTEGFIHWGKWTYALTLNVDTEIITITEAPLPPLPCHYSFYYQPEGIYLCWFLVKTFRGKFGRWNQKLENGRICITLSWVLKSLGFNSLLLQAIRFPNHLVGLNT